MKKQPAKILKRVSIETSLHAKLKALANRRGMKLEALAQRLIEVGLQTEGAK